jgi:hypothetical protein
MKNLFKIPVVIVLLLVSSCSDFLEEKNKSSATAENFYVTTPGYEALINSTYSTLRDVYEPLPFIFSAGTDLFFAAGQEAPPALTSYTSLTPGTSQVRDFFQTLYESIQVANTALHYAALTDDFPELQSRVGEARFLRGYYYFLLVQQFGDVSLVTEMIDNPITHFERLPANVVYEFIISELEQALIQIPETQTDWGRVTRRAVQHLLAKVYLTRGYEEYGQATDFSTAASYADQAINGQALTLPFAEVFAYENDVNEEVIFSVQYDQASLHQGGRHNWDTPWGPLITGTGDGVFKKVMLHPTEYLWKVFGEYDSRFEGTFMNIRTSPFVGYHLDKDNYPINIYYPRTAEQMADTVNWRAADPEFRSETIIIPMNPFWWHVNNQGEYPALMKFDRVQLPDVRYTHDLFLMRLGETYLIGAEAYFQAGNLPTAKDRINAVRNRAAMPGHEADMLIDESDITIDFILDERARELAGEGHRWLDLKRTGKLIERTVLYNPDITSASQFMGSNGNYKILRPIPLSVIALDSENYPQNPAYE